MVRTLSTFSVPTLAMMVLAGCSMLPGGGSQPRETRSQQRPVATSGETRQCLSQLGGRGAQFVPLPDQYHAAGCSTVGTVQLTGLRSDEANLAIANLGPVTCEVSTVFADWARYGVDRAARQVLGSPLRSIETMGSYSCRNVAGTSRRSAHSTAQAVDVGAFVLEDGRRITVRQGWSEGTAREREFLRLVHRSACKRFGTVLGPEYNAAHRDHFHVEKVIDGQSFCR